MVALLTSLACSRIDPHFVQPGRQLTVSGAVADPRFTPRRDAKFDPAVNVVKGELSANLGEGVSISVMEQGRLTWVQGFGSADPFDASGLDAVQPYTLFQIGPVARSMTAVEALIQVQRGAMSLDDTVGELLPDFSLAWDPDWSDRATLDDLLSSRSGLYDYLDWSGSEADRDLADWHYGFYADQMWDNSPPGALWNESATDYGFAGLAAEARDASGRWWADLVRQDLFLPLGMGATWSRKADAVAAGHYAQSTGLGAPDTFGYADVTMDEVPDPAYARPGESGWSTAIDLCTWGRFLAKGDPAVLDEDLRLEATRSHGSTGQYDEHQGFAYGMFVWDRYPMADGFRAIPVWEQGGSTRSFTSKLLVLPDQDVQIAILSNGMDDDWAGTVDAILRQVVNPLPPLSSYEGPAFEAAAIGRNQGTYVDAANLGDIRVSVDGDRLLVDIPGLTANGFHVEPVMDAISTDRWIVTIEGAPFEVAFLPGEGGVRYVRDHLFVGARPLPPILPVP